MSRNEDPRQTDPYVAKAEVPPDTYVLPRPASRPRVIVDCDPGHDDMFALGVAAAWCDVVAITAVAGNSPLTNTERNARIGRELFGMDSTLVFSGASRPLMAEPEYAPEAHGRTGLDGPPERTPTRSLDGTDAVEYLVEATRAEEGLWLIALGPLTNVALALRADPAFAERIAGLSLMGGSTTHGNVTAISEFNIYVDPEAAAEVLSAGIGTVRMFGLNLTHQVRAGQATIDALDAADTDRSRFCAGLLRFSQRFNANIYGLPPERVHEASAPMHDPCAVLGVVRPDLFTFADRHVVCETVGAHTRGMTLVDERPWRHGNGANVAVAYGANAPEALALITAAAS